jgi:cytochrome c556
MKRASLVLAVLSLAVTGAAYAQQNPIKARQDLMTQNGDATKLVNQMLKGDKPYDAAAAAAALNSIGDAIEKFVTLFPEGSVGKDTDAKPEIWTNRADFDSWAPSLKQASVKAAQAAANGPDALRPAFAEVADHCQGCHEKYRIEK